LRAEAARLEAEQKEVDAENLAKLFRSFDSNNDGIISVQELQEGLSAALAPASKSGFTVTSEQAARVLAAFDLSGDGALQLSEFPPLGVEAFRSRLEQLLRDEESAVRVAREQLRRAQAEARALAEIAAMINNEPPSGADRVLALLPFLLPFLDSLEYSRALIAACQLQDNPVVSAVLQLSRAFEAVPFSGLATFYLFSLWVRNLSLNRLIRFSIQQAILLDVALILPGLGGSVAGVLSGGSVDAELAGLASSVTFFAMLVCVTYSVLLTALGKEPGGIPFISDRVRDRVPTTEQFQQMFNVTEGQIRPKDPPSREKPNNRK